MDIHVTAGIVAGLLNLVSFVFYFVSIFRDETKPNLSTWFVWAVIGTFALVSYWVAGDQPATIWIPVFAAVGPILVVIVIFKRDSFTWTKLDGWCLVIALASILVWAVTGSAVLALVMNLLADEIGSIPTMWKIFKDPKAENFTAWFIYFIANIVNLFAVREWTMGEAVYPLYAVIAVGLYILLLSRRWIVRKPLLVSV